MPEHQEDRLIQIGHKYLKKLLKRGDIDQDMYDRSLEVLQSAPELFSGREPAPDPHLESELMPFGQSFSEVMVRRDKEEPVALVANLSAIVMNKEQASGLDSLSVTELYVYVLYGMITDVNNGGFSGFFYNGTAELANHLLPALEAVGSRELKKIATEALNLFGDCPALDEDSRYAHLQIITQDGDLDLWADCNERFYDCTEDLESLILDYVAQDQG